MTVIIHLTKGFEALVDDIDADLAELKWTVMSKPGHSYAYRNSKGKTVYLHRVILQRILEREISAKDHVDHINADGLDNRRSNLRVATPSENYGNARKKIASQNPYKGANRIANNKKNPWVAAIRVNGKAKHLGNFPTAEAAHIVYCLAAYAKWGEFANFGENSPFKGWTLEQLEAHKQAA